MYWKQWLQTLLSLVILLGVLEMLLPPGELAKFSKLVLGLTLMLAILQPLALVLNPDTPPLDLTWLQPNSAPELQTLADRVRLAAVSPLFEHDADGFLGELEEILRQTAEIHDAKISVQRQGQQGAVVHVFIDPYEAATQLRVKQSISAMLNLPTSEILVLRLTDQGGDPWESYGVD